jgi:hypothetical protein
VKRSSPYVGLGFPDRYDEIHDERAAEGDRRRFV